MPKTKRAAKRSPKLLDEVAAPTADDTREGSENDERTDGILAPTVYRGLESTAPSSRLDMIPVDKRNGTRIQADTSSAKSVSIEKHCENLRYKIAWTADRLADELATSVRGKAKKDHNYIRSLVWSLGVLFDKLTPVANDAVTIRVPAALLANVSAVIALQAQPKREQLDSLSGAQVIDSTSYEPVVAHSVAERVDPSAQPGINPGSEP